MSIQSDCTFIFNFYIIIFTFDLIIFVSTSHQWESLKKTHSSMGHWQWLINMTHPKYSPEVFPRNRFPSPKKPVMHSWHWVWNVPDSFVFKLQPPEVVIKTYHDSFSFTKMAHLRWVMGMSDTVRIVSVRLAPFHFRTYLLALSFAYCFQKCVCSTSSLKSIMDHNLWFIIYDS